MNNNIESSYEATVCRIKTRPHPNADRVQLGSVCGFQVVVGLDVKDGDLGVYFPTDGALSHDMCMANKLYTTHPETGEKMGGYFSRRRRVVTQRFRGEKSEGFWMPISALSWCGKHNFVEGETFTHINNKLVCERYYVPRKNSTLAGGKKKNKLSHLMFGKEKEKTEMLFEHIKTSQWPRFNHETMPTGALVVVTEKLHGTSGRTGNLLVTQPLPLWKRLVNKMMRRSFFKRDAIWRIVSGSRRVVKYAQKGWREEIGFNIGKHLRKGETLYYEIVGWDDKGVTIMSPHQTAKSPILKKDKRFGDRQVYAYGQAPGTWGIYVYRITMVNIDGDVTEYSWSQVVERCAELGLKTVPELARFFVKHVPERGESNREEIKDYVDSFIENYNVSTLDNSHISEGVCIRIEHESMNNILKAKNFEFRVLESAAKDQDDYTDMEEDETFVEEGDLNYDPMATDDGLDH